MEKIEIALACDERYFPGLLGTIASLLTSAAESSVFTIHILDGGINKSSHEKLSTTLQKFKQQIEINIIEINVDVFRNLPSFFYESKMTYARILLASLLKIKKVIYIDTDILVLKDISKLWQTEFDTHAAVCVETIIGRIKNDCPIYNELGLDGDAPYFNAGLMVMNLDKFRADDIAGKTFTYLREYHDYCKFWDQSALNVTLYNKLTWLDYSWNVQAHREVYHPVRDLHLLSSFAINFHFVTSQKPWLFYSNLPEYQMFYMVYDAIGYQLNMPGFIQSKTAFFKKVKMLWLLPSYFKSKAMVNNWLNNHTKSDMLLRGAEYWKHFRITQMELSKKESVLKQLYLAWNAKFKDKRSAQ